MNDNALMEELVKNSRKQLFYARIRMFASIVTAAALIICLAVVAPAASETISLANTAITSITAMSKSITEMGDNMDTFITENAETVAAVMEKIEAVDFEGLNSAIKNLGDVVAPLAKFFNLF